MKKYIFLSLLLVIILVGVNTFVKTTSNSDFSESHPAFDKDKGYSRIISLLPSITETLYALGLGNRVVGVTRYCKYPPDAQSKPKIGGIVDINYEIAYKLNPDLAVILKDNSDHKKMLTKMGIPIIEMETRSVSGILTSIKSLGSKFKKESQATKILNKIEAKIDSIKSKTRNLTKPRVLITYYRTVGEGNIRQVYIAGDHTYFNDLLKILGAENAYKTRKVITSPIVTPEGIIQMDPDIIIEVMNMLNTTNLTPADVLEDWDSLSNLRAYKNKRIYIFNQDYIDIPGPRLAEALDTLARVIHPDINWDN